jgi:hypothetical protein
MAAPAFHTWASGSRDFILERNQSLRNNYHAGFNRLAVEPALKML